MKQEITDFWDSALALVKRKRVLAVLAAGLCIVVGGEPGTCLTTLL
jgi:hypothetical protein